MYWPQPVYLYGYMESLRNYLKVFDPQMSTIIAINIAGLVVLVLLFYFLTVRRYNNQTVSFCNVAVPFFDLHKAIFENHVIASIRLIEKYPEGINHLHPVDGYTPFMRACLNGNTQLVSLMINSGADISLKSAKGETPFYLAVFHLIENRHYRDATCIRVLYYAGSDVNATTDKGYTALHLAAMFGHSSLVRWLLSKGACTTVQPFPYVVARLQGHYETAMLLKNRGLPAIE